MTGLIVITRPIDDAHDYAAELEQSGFQTLIEPMLSLEALEFDAPSLDDYDGILATSANALQFYKSGGGEIHDIPVYCVGKHTADAAKEIGFQNAISVDGTGADLLEHLLSLSDAASQRFLHICGQHVAFPLVEKLSEQGVKADTLPVYASVQTHGFTPEFISALKKGEVEAITFFSKRTAQAFVQNVLESESESLFSQIKTLSISEAVIECVRVLPWQASYVSQTPDRVGMMQLLKAYVSD